jgi:hypothetical protein
VLLGGQQRTGSIDMTGFIGGFQGGCNYQVGAWVWGVEVDGSATNKEGQAFNNVDRLIAAAPGGFLAVSPNGVVQLQERWLVTARGRLGWTIWDKTMLYVTGGGTWAKIDDSRFLNPAKAIVTTAAAWITIVNTMSNAPQRQLASIRPHLRDCALSSRAGGIFAMCVRRCGATRHQQGRDREHHLPSPARPHLPRRHEL